ncbi:hypothetical protein [Rubritalea profundi]|nr:hypothetical protein [Rubritalea profundi]
MHKQHPGIVTCNLNGRLVGYHPQKRLIPEIEEDVFLPGIKPELAAE